MGAVPARVGMPTPVLSNIRKYPWMTRTKLSKLTRKNNSYRVVLQGEVVPQRNRFIGMKGATHNCRITIFDARFTMSTPTLPVAK